MLVMLMAFSTTFAKSYKWKGLDHTYDVVLIKQASAASQILKVYGIAGNPDKAIEQALQDAVAAAIFTGYPKKLDVPQPALCEKVGKQGIQFYQANQSYFDAFFKKGEFMNYVKNVNTRYPSGENNIAVDGGRKVGVNIEINLTALREKLEADGILPKLGMR